MGWFDDYMDAAPRAKTMKMYHFPSKQIVTTTIIAETSLKSFYSRLGFKVIKYFATSPNFEEACKQFHYDSVKSKALKKKTLAYNVI